MSYATGLLDECSLPAPKAWVSDDHIVIKVEMFVRIKSYWSIYCLQRWLREILHSFRRNPMNKNSRNRAWRCQMTEAHLLCHLFDSMYWILEVLLNHTSSPVYSYVTIVRQFWFCKRTIVKTNHVWCQKCHIWWEAQKLHSFSVIFLCN